MDYVVAVVCSPACLGHPEQSTHAWETKEVYEAQGFTDITASWDITQRQVTDGSFLDIQRTVYRDIFL